MFKRSEERKANRLKNYDYSENGYYFVTICTKNMQEYFGKIENEKMVLNEIGNFVKKCWLEIPQHFPSVFLDEFVVMPNHIHGIIIIEKDDNHTVGNRHACSLQTQQKRHIQKLPTVIGSFKSAVSKIINEKRLINDFQWQKSFYDKIIINETSLKNIREYIVNNPLKWDLEKNNIENLM